MPVEQSVNPHMLIQSKLLISVQNLLLQNQHVADIASNLIFSVSTLLTLTNA